MQCSQWDSNPGSRYCIQLLYHLTSHCCPFPRWSWLGLNEPSCFMIASKKVDYFRNEILLIFDCLKQKKHLISEFGPLTRNLILKFHFVSKDERHATVITFSHYFHCWALFQPPSYNNMTIFIKVISHRMLRFQKLQLDVIAFWKTYAILFLDY